MLRFLDILFTGLHLAIICFNLFAWIWKPLRKAHLICVLLTLTSWLILGIWFGFGYCPLTDWHWDVKRQLGEQHLPNSFIKYFADRITGRSFDAGLVDMVTGITFGIAIVFSVLVNFFKRPSV